MAEAAATAARQGSLGLALRAALTEARLGVIDGDPARGRERLLQARSAVSAGSDTEDVREAAVLLDAPRA